MVYRLAQPRDAWPIALMSRRLIEYGMQGWSWSPDRVARAIGSSHVNALVAIADRQMAGFALMEYGDTQAHLSLLAVSPDYQRRRIGSQMMTWLEESALVAGIARITLELRAGNCAARDFYLALGFAETASIPGYYRGVETALRMSRDIRRPISDRIN